MYSVVILLYVWTISAIIVAAVSYAAIRTALIYESLMEGVR